MSEKAKVVGRYAPSPTGDLHFGNLRTAMLAWLHARLQGGKFIVRMEDLDTPRVVPGSADQILRDLEWLGLDWDGPVVYQSKRSELYEHALDQLTRQGLSYPCFCSRKDIRMAASAPHGNVGLYSGACRDLTSLDIDQRKLIREPSVRLKVPDQLSGSVDDFVIKRADNIFAYQLAVTVDDLDQGVTEVVRGEDLLDSTPKQRYLGTLLRPCGPTINYLHTPLMLDADGRRMSKRDGSISIRSWKETSCAPETLLGFLAFTCGIQKVNKPINKDKLIDLANIKAILSKISLFF